MTREEAIELIENMSVAFVPTDQYGDYDDPEPYDEAVNMAIEALKAEPTGDLISRQELLQDIGELKKSPWYNNNANGRAVIIREAVGMVEDVCIKALPSAEPVQTQGDLISREAAIEAIASHDPTNGDSVFYFKGKTVIGYIEDLPSAEPVDCTDFIRWIRDEVMDEENWELNAVAKGEVICRKLEKLGAVFTDGGYYRTAEPVHGEWIDEDEVTHKYFKCSECGVGQFNWGEDRYCRNCGARME